MNKNHKKLLSTVCDPEKRDWADDALLLPHETIRRMVLDLEFIVKEENLNIFDEQKLRAIFKLFNDYIFFFIHHHHDIEEQFYFPWLKSKGAKLPEEVKQEHDLLLKLLIDFKNIDNKKFYQERNKEKLEEMRRIVAEMKKFMDAHLSAEENFAPKILREYFTPEEEQKKSSGGT